MFTTLLRRMVLFLGHVKKEGGTEEEIKKIIEVIEIIKKYSHSSKIIIK